jgi:transcriptional regulator with XRE-family HTH domain
MDDFSSARLFSCMLGLKQQEVGACSLPPGQRLRQIRCSLGLTLRDVEAASDRIATEHRNPCFSIPFSRLHEIETKGMLPTIYRLYSLSAIYGIDYGSLLGIFGVDLDRLSFDLKLASVPVTHKINADLPARISVASDEDGSKTRVVAKVMTPPPANNIGQPSQDRRIKQKLCLIHVGTEDYTMFPLIAPSSLLEVDDRVRRIRSAGWHSEHDRPIYLFETRHDGFRIGWCSLSNNLLTIQPHPLSPTPAKTYRYPVEAEIVGQVVAVSTRLAAAPSMGASAQQSA